jgi:CHAD domain-containing protein
VCMALDPQKLEKPLLKLRKTLKKMNKRPSPELVHDLRTNTRKVEATVHALQLDRKRKGRGVLKVLTPLRKRAGKVRDMDVLTGFAATLSEGSGNECLVRLLEHLGEVRLRGARKLNRAAAQRKQSASRRLKKCLNFIERKLKTSKKRDEDFEWPVDAAAAAMHIAGEVQAWPKLNKNNLHPFRLKVKELRNVLQLSGEKGELMGMLGDVKDVIGEWHDWTELSAIAKELLPDCPEHDLVKQIEDVTRKKFASALKIANRLRASYFEDSRLRRKRGRRSKASDFPLLKSAARLAV